MLPEGSKKGGCRHVDDLCSTPVRRVDDCLCDRFAQTLKYSVRKKQRRKEYVACFFICDYYFGRVDTWRRKMIPAASDCTNTPRAAFGGATALRCSAVPAPCFHAQRVLPAGPPQKRGAFRLPAWLRGLLRRNRFSARSPTPSCASCRLRRGDRVALLRRPSSLFPRATRSSGRSTTKKAPPKRCLIVVDLRGLEPRSYRVRLRTLHV